MQLWIQNKGASITDYEMISKILTKWSTFSFENFIGGFIFKTFSKGPSLCIRIFSSLNRATTCSAAFVLGSLVCLWDHPHIAYAFYIGRELLKNLW